MLAHHAVGYTLSIHPNDCNLLSRRRLSSSSLFKSQMAIGGGQNEMSMPPSTLNREASSRSTQRFIGNNNSPRNIRYSEFLKLVDANRIDKVTFR